MRGGADRGSRLLVFAKAPEPGKVKTRLIAALGAEGAADLHRRLVRRALRTARESALGEVELWCAPDAKAPFFADCQLDFGVELHAQGEGDLGERMRRAIDAALARSSRAIVLGSDVPALEPGHLRDADRALREGCECVLGPAEDGGYVLIGLARSRPELLRDIRWGGADVLAETRRRVASLGIRCRELPLLWDVDRPDDLERLRRLDSFDDSVTRRTFMTVKEKTVVKMRLQGSGVSHSRTDVSARDLKVTIDEPIERGGTNLGLSPTETLLAALIGCTNVITHKIAHRHGVDIKSMNIRVEAEFDRRGVQLAEEVDVPFPSLTLFVDIATRADAAAVDTVKRELAMFCPVSKVLRRSGTEVKEIWNITPA